MEHVMACPDCGRFWTELQRAQELVLELPRERVSGDFRDALWERIKAGEGTPEASFRDPIPLRSHLRDAALGACAAALLMALLWGWMRNDGEPVEEGDEPVAEANDHLFEFEPAEVDLLEPKPFAPPYLAQVAANRVARSHTDLDRHLTDLEARLRERRAERTGLQGLIEDVRREAETMNSSGRIVLFLARDGHAGLPPETEVQLELVDRLFEATRLTREDSPRRLVHLLKPVLEQTHTLPELPRRLKVRVGAYTTQELRAFPAHLLTRLRPEDMRALHLEVDWPEDDLSSIFGALQERHSWRLPAMWSMSGSGERTIEVRIHDGTPFSVRRVRRAFREREPR